MFLLLYPYVFYPAVLKFLPRKNVRRADYDASISLLFCAYNEAQSIAAKIENLRQLKARYPDLEILAYDDGSQDGTGGLLLGASDTLTLVKGQGRTGKAAGMQKLAGLARGEILVFTDANVLLDEAAIANLLPYYADDEIGGVCGTLCYIGEEKSETASISSGYWKLDERLRSLESATGNVMGADGSIFSIRRSLYPVFPDSVLDDLTVSMSVIFAGMRLVKADDVVAFENSVSAHEEELRRKIRIGARAMHTHLYLRPQLRQMPALDRFKYSSRKYLRWHGAFFLFAAIVLALVSLFLRDPAIAVSAALGIGAILGVLASLPAKPAVRIRRAMTLLFATEYGVLQGMAGRKYVTWSPAKTR